MTRQRVDAAVERVRARDEGLGRDAGAAAGWLTAGEGVDMIDQLSLQEFLWWHLPRKLPPSEWDGLVSGAVALLDELGLERYVDIARSETTQRILGAWRFNPDQADKLARDAEKASGVLPPDTDLIQWGAYMGVYENTARQAVARALDE